jgi:hypothetical protein
MPFTDPEKRREAQRKYDRKRYEIHHAAEMERRRKYYAANRDARLEYKRLYRDGTRDMRREYAREYRQVNRDALNAVDRERQRRTAAAFANAPMRRQPWSSAEDRVILTSDASAVTLAAQTGRTPEAIKQRRHKLRKAAAAPSKQQQGEERR